MHDSNCCKDILSRGGREPEQDNVHPRLLSVFFFSSFSKERELISLGLSYWRLELHHISTVTFHGIGFKAWFSPEDFFGQTGASYLIHMSREREKRGGKAKIPKARLHPIAHIKL